MEGVLYSLHNSEMKSRFWSMCNNGKQTPCVHTACVMAYKCLEEIGFVTKHPVPSTTSRWRMNLKQFDFCFSFGI